MRRIHPLMIGVLATASVVLAGCGSSISKEDFASSFAGSTGDESPLSEEQATCIGENIYDEVGEDRMNELNDEMDDSTTIPKELIGPVAKAGPRCAGAGDVLRKQLEADEVTPEQADCIVQAINEDDILNQQVWDALAASYGGDQSKADDVKDAIADAATKCIVE